MAQKQDKSNKTAEFISAVSFVPVAQLDRATDSDSVGHAFKSHQAHQNRYRTVDSGFFMPDPIIL